MNYPLIGLAIHTIIGVVLFAHMAIHLGKPENWKIGVTGYTALFIFCALWPLGCMVIGFLFLWNQVVDHDDDLEAFIDNEGIYWGD